MHWQTAFFTVIFHSFVNPSDSYDLSVLSNLQVYLKSWNCWVIFWNLNHSDKKCDGFSWSMSFCQAQPSQSLTSTKLGWSLVLFLNNPTPHPGIVRNTPSRKLRFGMLATSSYKLEENLIWTHPLPPNLFWAWHSSAPACLLLLC